MWPSPPPVCENLVTARSAPMSQAKVPTAFISYSHDSLDHKKWVLDLATRLRNNGVDAILDQWSLGPGDDLPVFMERNLASADRVLMVCTDNYVTKANNGAGGVGYEKMIVTAELLKSIDSNKVIPLIRQTGTHRTPTFLRSKLFLDFSRPDQFEFSFDELIRSLHGAPLYAKPPVANNPFAPVAETPVDRTGDGVLKAMEIVVAVFETVASELLEYWRIVRAAERHGLSRVLLDIYLEAAEHEKLVERAKNHSSFLKLTSKGKIYAVQHGLVK